MRAEVGNVAPVVNRSNSERFGQVCRRADAGGAPGVACGKDDGCPRGAECLQSRLKERPHRVGAAPRVVDHIGRFRAVGGCQIAGKIGGAEKPLKRFEPADVVGNAFAGHGVGTDARHSNPARAWGHANRPRLGATVADHGAHGVGAVGLIVAIVGFVTGAWPKVAIGVKLAIRFKPVVVVVKGRGVHIAAVGIDQRRMVIDDACVKAAHHCAFTAHTQFLPDTAGPGEWDVPGIVLRLCGGRMSGGVHCIGRGG